MTVNDNDKKKPLLPVHLELARSLRIFKDKDKDSTKDGTNW